MQPKQFDLQFVIASLRKLVTSYHQNYQIPFGQFCEILNEYCYIFKQLNSFLGIAFSDVKEKIGIIQHNNTLYPGHPGFFAFIEMEIEKGIHVYNGDNNAELKAPKEFAKYNSTARNLLRMMWLLTFIRVTFEQCKDKPTESLAHIFNTAYDAAFGEKHSWLIRKGAKLAIMASSDRKRLVEVVNGSNNEETFQQKNQRFLKLLIPLHEALWKFYKQRNLLDLD